MGPAHKISVLITYVKTPLRLINAHADIFSIARSLNFGLSLHLHPFFVYASSEGFGESAHIADAISIKILYSGPQGIPIATYAQIHDC